MVYLSGSMVFGQNEKPFVKGAILTGGSLSINIEKEKELFKGSPPDADITYIIKSKSFITNFQIGYFILNHFSVGIKSKIAFTNCVTSDDLSSSIIWDINDRALVTGPFFRFYSKSGLFFEGFGGVGFQNQKTFGNKFKQNVNAFNAGLGYCFILNKCVALEPVFSYELLNKNSSETEKKISVDKFTLSLGLQFYLANRKI